MKGFWDCLQPKQTNKQTNKQKTNKQTTYQDFPFDGVGVGDAKKDDGKKNVPN